MQYTEHFLLAKLKISIKKGFFLFYAQNIDCGYTLDEGVLTSTHNLCFGLEIRKTVYPCKPQFFYIKVVFKRRIHCMDMFS